MRRYTRRVDPPLADVVSFAERASTRQRQQVVADGAQRPPADEDIVAEPADLAREAMIRRFGQLGYAGPTERFRSVDDVLAVLVYDSAIEPEPLVGIRGDASGSTRQLTFESPALTIEVQLEGSARELTCQVVPPQPASLEVRHEGGTLGLMSDEYGTFFAPSLPAGAVSLRCTPLSGDTEPVVTSWFTPPEHPFA